MAKIKKKKKDAVDKVKDPSKKKRDKSANGKKSTKSAKKKENGKNSTNPAGRPRGSRIKIKNIRISMRIAKKVTSITLNTTVVGLWMLFCTDDDPSDYKKVKGRINEFVYSCLPKWERDDAKGLSEYIANRMVRACLDQKDFKLYKKFVKTISAG